MRFNLSLFERQFNDDYSKQDAIRFAFDFFDKIESKSFTPEEIIDVATKFENYIKDKS